MITINRIDADTKKEDIARTVLEALPDWFGIPDATEEYIADSKGKSFFCAYDDQQVIGFLYLKETGRQLYVSSKSFQHDDDHKQL